MHAFDINLDSINIRFYYLSILDACTLHMCWIGKNVRKHNSHNPHEKEGQPAVCGYRETFVEKISDPKNRECICTHQYSILYFDFTSLARIKV